MQDFGNLFVEMQEKRHKADYDPTFRVNKSKALADIETVRRIIERFQKIEIKDKKAFAAWVLYQVRA